MTETQLGIVAVVSAMFGVWVAMLLFGKWLHRRYRRNHY